MKATIIHILCEGQTEEGFVKEVLRPYLSSKGIIGVKSILVTTNKKKNARGGMLTYSHALSDLGIMLKTNPDGEYERHVFTTMFDLYALPDDFPGYQSSKDIHDPYARIDELEKAFALSIQDKRFIPYIQLHEFEALLFCGIEYIAQLYPGCETRCEQLKETLRNTGNPELINHSPETAPSKRIIRAIEEAPKSRYHYNKPQTGKVVTQQIGMDALRSQCRHFDEWIEKLLRFGAEN